jgi:hypothetical protein
MVGKLTIATLIVASMFVSCSESTTAPDEAKMYLWHQQRSATEMVRYQMTKNSTGIWQAAVTVTDTGGTTANNHGFYAFFSTSDEIKIGMDVFGDTTSIGGNVNVSFPVTNVGVKRERVTTQQPRLRAYQIDKVPMGTVTYTFDEGNLAFSLH